MARVHTPFHSTAFNGSQQIRRTEFCLRPARRFYSLAGPEFGMVQQSPELSDHFAADVVAAAGILLYDALSRNTGMVRHDPGNTGTGDHLFMVAYPFIRPSAPALQK